MINITHCNSVTAGNNVYVSGILIVGSSFIVRLANFMASNRKTWNLPIPVRLTGRPGL